MSQSLNPFGGGSATKEPAGKPTDVDAIVDLFDAKDDTKEPAKKDDKKIEGKKDDDKDNDLEPDEEPIKLADEDPDKVEPDDKIDLEAKEETDIKIVAPPKIKEIEKKYPELFKDFPFLSKMMARDKQYTELFGSFDEAKEVASKVERLNEFETQLLGGDTRDVLKQVKETDAKAFDKIVDNYLPALEAVDKDAYIEVCGNFVKRIIIGMSQKYNKSGKEELKTTAEGLHEYIFGSPLAEWEDPKVRVKEDKSSADKELEQERSKFTQERFEVARDDLQTRVDNTLKATIDSYIDPKNELTAYEKKNAINEVLDQLHSEIRKDGTYLKNLDKLWKASEGTKFSRQSLEDIKKSYLGKSKDHLGSIIKRVRAEILKDKDKTSSKKEEKEEETTPVRRKTINAGRPTQQNNKAKEERQKGESVEDFFARD